MRLLHLFWEEMIMVWTKGFVERWLGSGCVLKAESKRLASRLNREQKKGIKEDCNILGLHNLKGSADIFGGDESEN